jgi:hypothetical protein
MCTVCTVRGGYATVLEIITTLFLKSYKAV